MQLPTRRPDRGGHNYHHHHHQPNDARKRPFCRDRPRRVLPRAAYSPHRPRTTPRTPHTSPPSQHDRVGNRADPARYPHFLQGTRAPKTAPRVLPPPPGIIPYRKNRAGKARSNFLRVGHRRSYLRSARNIGIVGGARSSSRHGHIIADRVARCPLLFLLCDEKLIDVSLSRSAC